MTRYCSTNVAQMFPKVAQRDATIVFTLSDTFHNSPKVTDAFGLLCKQICCQELSEISQSGHIEGTQRSSIEGTDFCVSHRSTVFTNLIEHVLVCCFLI